MMALTSAGASVPVPPADHGHFLGSSACRDVMTLPSRPSAVPAARAHARRVLASGHPARIVKVVWAEWARD
jgi:hypothetical protein